MNILKVDIGLMHADERHYIPSSSTSTAFRRQQICSAEGFVEWIWSTTALGDCSRASGSAAAEER